MRRPLRKISPLAMRPGGSSKPMIAAPVSDFPAPDSPTTPNTSPGAIENETLSTAFKTPRLVGNSMCKFLTSRTGCVIGEMLEGEIKVWKVAQNLWPLRHWDRNGARRLDLPNIRRDDYCLCGRATRRITSGHRLRVIDHEFKVVCIWACALSR